MSHVNRPSPSCVAVLATALLGSTLLADIQEPPLLRYTAIRKLARGIANVGFGWTELIDTGIHSADQEPFHNAVTFGSLEGAKRTVFRLGMGFFEILTFPTTWPATTYKAQLKPSIPWVSTGYEEFPPHLGVFDRYDYSRVPSPHHRTP